MPACRAWGRAGWLALVKGRCGDGGRELLLCCLGLGQGRALGSCWSGGCRGGCWRSPTRG